MWYLWLQGERGALNTHTHTHTHTHTSLGNVFSNGLLIVFKWFSQMVCTVFGHVLFILYAVPVSTVIEKRSVLHLPYADDSQLKNMYPIIESLTSSSQCRNVSMTFNCGWHWPNLSDNKTEAMIVSSGRKSRSLSFSFLDVITVGGASVPLSDSVKNLGVTLDCHLTMKT